MSVAQALRVMGAAQVLHAQIVRLGMSVTPAYSSNLTSNETSRSLTPTPLGRLVITLHEFTSLIGTLSTVPGSGSAKQAAADAGGEQCFFYHFFDKKNQK